MQVFEISDFTWVKKCTLEENDRHIVEILVNLTRLLSAQGILVNLTRLLSAQGIQSCQFNTALVGIVGIQSRQFNTALIGIVGIQSRHFNTALVGIGDSVSSI